MHVGHTRGAVFGDALAGLLGFAGWEVTREYYINDGGAQVDVLARSAYERYREACGLEPEIAEGLYPGDYLIPVGEALRGTYGMSLLDKPEAEWLAPVRAIATEAMMAMIRDDLALLGVRMDVFFSEKSLYGTGLIEAALASLKAKGLLYEGVLEPPKGKLPEDWEPRRADAVPLDRLRRRHRPAGDEVGRGLDLFRAGHRLSLRQDRARLRRADRRARRRPRRLRQADEGGGGGAEDGRVPLDVKLCQLVRLFKGGEPFKMSKRAGTFVTLRDVVEQVGPDVTRFVMLTRKNDAPLDFDFDKALEQIEGEPGLLRAVCPRAGAVGAAARRGCPTTGRWRRPTSALLGSAGELGLVRKLAEWPRQVEVAAQSHEPHRIAFYLYDLASEFHALQHQGKLEPELRFVREDAPDLTRARLALVRATQVVIAAGLGILGVTPMDEMR